MLVNDEVGGIDEAGVETGIEGDLFGEVADTEVEPRRGAVAGLKPMRTALRRTAGRKA